MASKARKKQAVMNLNQVTISSLEVTKSTEFYTTLGLKLIVDALPRYVRFECPDRDSTFSIHSVDKLLNDNKITLYFEVNKLTTAVLELNQKGGTFNTTIME
tara:strand:- start:720 stop:1025 length:306 start_codon:yes stop_codon:yes gene_type:complete